jgi:hypothetical protein
MTRTSRNRILSRIAKDVLHIATLKTRKGGDLDFYEVAVWQVRRALELAFMVGQCHPPKTTRVPAGEVHS